MPLNEADIEQIALDWFAECGYTCLHGPDIAPDEPVSENRLMVDARYDYNRSRSADTVF